MPQDVKYIIDAVDKISAKLDNIDQKSKKMDNSIMKAGKSLVAFFGAREAIKAGAGIINDISAFEKDPDMVNVAAETGAPVILMHMKG